MNRFGWIFIFLSCITVCRAKEYKDTLWTTDHDRIIITYDLRYNSEGVDIRFLGAKKKLGRINEERYKKLENIEVIFFDRTGVYEDMTFTNMTPEAFMVPSDFKYTKSDLGYFSLQDRPSLSFKIVGNEKKMISIPLYLAYYQGKGERKLFSVCKKFGITLTGNHFSNRNASRNDVSEIVTSTYELESDNEKAIEVSTQVNSIMVLLEAQSKLPFTDGLLYEITCLRNLQKEVKDKQLLSKIKECLISCELKKMELERKASSEAEKAQIEAETLARLERERALARQDSISVVQQKKAEAEKKRNVWMIVGGGIFAVLCLVGNQVFQHFRNIRNQRSMMEMQQNIARQAENEAKRQARNFARRKTDEVVRNAQKSTREMMRNKVKQSGGNKTNKISI